MTSARLRCGHLKNLARIGGAALVLAIASGTPALSRNPLKLPETQYEPVAWSMIDGWADDDHTAAFASFLKSCKAILKGPPSREGRPMVGALFKVCQKAVETAPQKPGEARAFFEQNFRPVRISPLGTPDGFVTGYYEPIVEGLTKKSNGFDYPLYRKPSNLLPGGRMAVAGAPVASEGKKKKRGPKRRLVSYYERAAIDDGILAGRDLEICWLKDPIESFFIHIQGSVRVLLDDGRLMRLNYAAANGHAYYAVGRWLIERNIVSKDEMSMDRIREWMERNPKEADELRRKNKSYVFFRETHLSSDAEPIGAQGVSLTPGRSIAVDHKLHTYGTPFFISAHLPIEGLKPDTWFKRLMIAQDTGGAIVGPARADLYFGAGDEAASVSGRLRHYGKFVMLAPKSLLPAADDDDDKIPLPRPRPANLMSDETAPAETPDAKPAAAKPETKPETAAPETAAAKTKPSKPVAAKKLAKTTEKPPEKPTEKSTEKPAKKKSEKAAEGKKSVKTSKQESKSDSKPDSKSKSAPRTGPKHDPQT
jgi:membrane-bound lytic murein transglycosylase A